MYIGISCSTPTGPATDPDRGAYAKEVPDWVVTATIASLYVDQDMTEPEVDAVLNERKNEHVSVLEVDARLSYYLSDEEFAAEVAFLDRIAEKAHERGMKAVIYYPSLEVLTLDGINLEHTMYKDHPDWVQIGLSGEPNVFYGSLEHWVEPGTESAWMSPNTDYREYYLDRIRALAATQLDGIWVDVPVYLDAGTEWSGAGPDAAEAFRAWSVSSGETAPPGYDLPEAVDFDDVVFRAWLRWRHHNIADFLEDIREAAHEVDPDTMMIVENFPIDQMDATAVGLDGLYRRSGKNYIRVWEIDSVCNVHAMHWAEAENFNSKIAMNKWSRAVERGNPAWVFSYGYQPIDAGLVIAAAAASGVVPFESQTPDMTKSVDSAFRARWFGFLRDHADEILATERYADLAVWYSAATRDYVDYPVGDGWGMYVNTNNVNGDPYWWSENVIDSALPKPHLGGWRGAAHALIQLGVPFEVVTEPGDPSTRLERVKLLWLPAVAAMSDASAAAIREFVDGGGVLLATGYVPATLDETGRMRPSSALADVLGFDGVTPAAHMHGYGDGLVIFRSDLTGDGFYASAVGAAQAADAVSAIQSVLRLHVPDALQLLDGVPGVHVEVARPSEQRHYLYVVNYSGLQQPVVSNPIDVPLDYRAPHGWRVASAEAVTPDAAGETGALDIEAHGDGNYRITVYVDQFAMVTVALEPDSSRQAAGSTTRHGGGSPGPTTTSRRSAPTPGNATSAAATAQAWIPSQSATVWHY